MSTDPVVSSIPYPDAYINHLASGRWELCHVRSKVTYHESQEAAYERLKEIREDGAGDDGGCLNCGS